MNYRIKTYLQMPIVAIGFVLLGLAILSWFAASYTCPAGSEVVYFVDGSFNPNCLAENFELSK